MAYRCCAHSLGGVSIQLVHTSTIGYISVIMGFMPGIKWGCDMICLHTVILSSWFLIWF